MVVSIDISRFPISSSQAPIVAEVLPDVKGLLVVKLYRDFRLVNTNRFLRLQLECEKCDTSRYLITWSHFFLPRKPKRAPYSSDKKPGMGMGESTACSSYLLSTFHTNRTKSAQTTFWRLGPTRRGSRGRTGRGTGWCTRRKSRGRSGWTPARSYRTFKFFIPVLEFHNLMPAWYLRQYRPPFWNSLTSFKINV